MSIAARLNRLPPTATHRRATVVAGIGTFFDLFDIFLAGVLGTVLGLAMGLGVAFHIDVIVPAIEHALGASFLPRDIYLISRMPSDPQASDIWPIALISLALAFIATLYPSWRASRIDPAEALRYE